ncbi:MAG: S-layer homology domain-containing protein [Oscillospiraceae bacterium]|nr:S-layer homology domain-containing protein [Oscillospiraceae bacterium]MBQ7118722.1 S-layer homology domain-containing protein [Oscillospiraceae bacterium]
MNKKILCLVISLCIIFSSFASAADFSDVPSDSEYYDAISHLANKGIINGYSDGTFNPSGNITRAEASAIIVRSAELDSDSAPSTIYRDVPENHWARGYIMAATEAKILDGFGNGIFSPSGNVTYNQIIKMIVCMIGKEDSARELGGWPMGYVDVALELDIIDRSTYSSILYKKLGDSPAPRGDVALFIYNALESVENNTLRVDNEEFVLGMSAENLGTPDEILSSSANFRWYVYNTDTYRNFYAIGVDKNRVVAIAATGIGFNYKGYICGSFKANDEKSEFIYTDSNDNNIIHSVLIFDDNYDIGFSDSVSISSDKLSGESKMNFHFTNAFRVYHGLKSLKWSDKAAKSARLHSEDMAENDYFSHTGQNGSTCASRMEAQGIDWSYCGENIAGGTIRYLGFHSFDGWVNSSGHRTNMLKEPFTYLGVGIAYDQSSKYTYYHTQNFHN